MAIDKELIDKLLADYKGPEDLIGEQGLLKQLTKALVERAMQAELTHHLGYEKHDRRGEAQRQRAQRHQQEDHRRAISGKPRSKCRATARHLRAADRAAA